MPLPLASVIGSFRDGRPIHAIAGGDGTAAVGEEYFPPLEQVRGLEAIREDRSRIGRRLESLDREWSGTAMTPEARAEFAALTERDQEAAGIEAELVARQATLDAIAARAGDAEGGGGQPFERVGATRAPGRGLNANAGTRLPDDIYELWSYRQHARSEEHYQQLLREGALRAIERAVFPHPDVDPDDVRADLSRLLDRVDDPDKLARQILGTGSPGYGRAFGEALATMDASKVRAMSLGTTTAGAFAVPFQLDPTVILTSAGVINPLRRMARVERITGRQWQGVTSAGITVSRSAEADPATDNSPTLAQPAVGTSRVTGFVPFSVEIESAWSAIQGEIAVMLNDAKDVEEATAFIDGDGTGNNPNGLIATLAAGSIVLTGDASFGVEDVYGVKNALPARFRPRQQFLAEGSIYDEIRQFDTAGGASLWAQLGEGRPAGLLGIPAEEISSMDSTVADGNDILLIGDFRQFLIVDRIGMTVELIPHLFQQAVAGAGVGMPTGQRGIYAHWHNGSEILVDNAFRLLRVGAS